MQVLIINPIIYTAETRNIARVESIKDSMIYDLCLAFHEQGHNVVLFAAEPYKPCCDEEYPFKIVWAKSVLPKIFLPHRLPFLPELYEYIKNEQDSLDMIISSEVFSVNSLMAHWAAPDKLLIWHELAKHNALFKKVPSKIWYNWIVKLFMKDIHVVARSKEARAFISQYCANVSEHIIDHGVNLNKFNICIDKENYFLVCSQLISRKRIDGIISKFDNYLKKYDSTAKLYIAGSGIEEEYLKNLVQKLQITSSVIFLGKVSHDRLQPILSRAKALLINTVKDNSMISIVEAISVGTPIVTTDVPLNSEYIIKNKLGIAKAEWDERDINEIVMNNFIYSENCVNYREELSTMRRVGQFIEVFPKVHHD